MENTKKLLLGILPLIIYIIVGLLFYGDHLYMVLIMLLSTFFLSYLLYFKSIFEVKKDLIYIICLIGFIIFSLMYPSQTSFMGKLVSIIGFILLPFFSTWILDKIIYLIYKAYELLPKNVYAQKSY